MKFLLVPVAALTGLLSSCTEPTPDHVPQHLCSDQSEPEEACWIRLLHPSGCYVQIPAYHAGNWNNALMLTWTGECVEGLAQGSGTLERTSREYTVWKHTGHLQAGQYHGEWEEDHTFGPSASYYDGTGSYVAGVRHGQWYEYFGKGFFREGPYVEGKKHGLWIEGGDDRFPHIGVERSEGPYVEGKKHGLWRTTTTRTQNYDYEELEKPEIRQTEEWFVSGEMDTSHAVELAE